MHQQRLDAVGSSTEAVVPTGHHRHVVAVGTEVGTDGEPEVRPEHHRGDLQVPTCGAERGGLGDVEVAMETGGDTGAACEGLRCTCEVDVDDQVAERRGARLRMQHRHASGSRLDTIDSDVGPRHASTAVWISSVKCSCSVVIDDAQRCSSTAASNPCTPGARVAVSRWTIST